MFAVSPCITALILYVQEEELEREKQEQVVLLQELEEQKAKLEQMLLEARQEREHLKAAVAQEVSVNQSGSPDSHQDATPGLITEVCLHLLVSTVAPSLCSSHFQCNNKVGRCLPFMLKCGAISASSLELHYVKPVVPSTSVMRNACFCLCAVQLLPPPGEDPHTRRVREYQQRLLEQNRLRPGDKNLFYLF